MDPIGVLKTIWKYKFWVLPVIVVTLIAGVYVFQFGPRFYESSMSVAIVNPSVPSEREIELNPELDDVNKDNPYLRSPDPSLITDVVVTRLNSSRTAMDVEAAGLGPEYSVGQGVDSNGFVVDITGIGSEPEKAVLTAEFLGERLQEDLRAAQKVNDADDTYLYTSLVIVQPDKPVEQFSSRLRSLIVVALGGGILMLGVLTVATSAARAQNRRRRLSSESPYLGNPVKVQESVDSTGSGDDPQRSDRRSTRQQVVASGKK